MQTVSTRITWMDTLACIFVNMPYWSTWIFISMEMIIIIINKRDQASANTYIHSIYPKHKSYIHCQVTKKNWALVHWVHTVPREYHLIHCFSEYFCCHHAYTCTRQGPYRDYSTYGWFVDGGRMGWRVEISVRSEILPKKKNTTSLPAKPSMSDTSFKHLKLTSK